MKTTLFTLAALFFFNCISLAEENYVVGFETVSVPDFKKDWKKTGNEPLKFPRRTETAEIVTTVSQSSPALSAGLQELDIIRVANGKLIKSHDEFVKLINGAGEAPIKLSVTRRVSNRWKNQVVELQPVTESRYYNTVLKKDGGMVYHFNSKIATNEPRGFYMHYSKRGSKPEGLSIRMSYSGGDWLFVRKCIITTKDHKYTLTPKKVYRKNGIDGLLNKAIVWEWFDIPIKTTDYKMIDDILTSKTTVRYEGASSYSEYELDGNHREEIRAVFGSYKLQEPQ